MLVKALILFSLVSGVCFSARAQKTPVYKPTRADVTNAADFAPIKGAQKVKFCRLTLTRCAFYAMAEHGLEGFGGPEQIYFFEHPFTFAQNGKTIGVFLFSILNREENPSSDERTRIEFVRERGGWRFVRMGSQTRCVNGRKISAWSKNQCE